MSTGTITYSLFGLLSSPKVPTDLLWVLTGIFGTLGVLYLFSVFFFRTKIKAREGSVADRKRELAPIISKFLFYTDEAPIDEKHEYIALKVEVRELLKEPFNRKVLAEILLDLKRDVSGNARDYLFKLYKDLGLHEDAYERIRSWRWEVVSKGITELTEMQVTDAYGQIQKFVNDRRGVVRKQAQLATVSLKEEGITYFLDTVKHAISEWQQLKLLDVLRHQEDFQPPRFKDWLTSKNKDVVLFALRLIKYYKQNDAQRAIITLVHHKNQQIKTEAINCIREFFIHEAVEPLKKAFRKGNTDVKLLILDTIGLLGGEKDIEFLKQINKRNYNFTIKSKALSTINRIQPESVLPTEGIEEAGTIELEPILNNHSDMEKEKNEELSVSIPEPDFNEDPMTWEDILNPDFEDEMIFDYCFREELKEILSEMGAPTVPMHEEDILPLDFLIYVENEPTEVQQETPERLESSIDNKSIHPEQKIIRDIEALLDGDSKKEEDILEDENLDLNFLPLLVEEDAVISEKEISETAQSVDIKTLEVICEELMEKVPEAFEEATKVPDNFSWQVPPQETVEAAKTIDWSAIAARSQPKPGDLVQQQETQQEGTNYGFSIFQELFRTADEESKLILLDEILAIGDKKELLFLEDLMEGDNSIIGEKAHQVYEQLTARLGTESDKKPLSEAAELSEDLEDETEMQMSAEEIRKKISLEFCLLEEVKRNPLDFLDVNFELITEDPEVTAPDGSPPKQTGKWVPKEEIPTAHLRFLRIFLNLHNKILEKLHG